MQELFEWKAEYMKVKCQIETCPQEALKQPRIMAIRLYRLELYLCPYHARNLRLAGHIQGED